MSDVFYESPEHGLLSIDSVYEFYEEPRLFSVSNEVGNIFVVYWAKTDDDSDTWFLIPISKKKLYSFEKKQTCIRDMLLYQEKKNFVKLTMPFDPDEKVNAEFILADQIQNLITLPKQGLYISSSPQTEVVESPALTIATHEIHIQKKSKKANKLVLENVSKIFEAFSGVYDAMVDTLDGIMGLEPVAARPGSFILSFNTEYSEVIDTTLCDLFLLIERQENIIPFIETNNINGSALCELLSQIVNSHTSFDLKENSSGKSIVRINSDDAKHYIKELNNYASTVINSSQVPQANDLNKLFEVVEKRSQGIYLTETELSLTNRQIQYYLHAASTLGFIKSYGSITGLGLQLADADHETRMKITARAFQLSHCGWAWLKWAGMRDISELDSSTAADFLIDKCSSLSESTARRRATTLKKWCSSLSGFYTGV